uniref:Sec-independent protein translocase component TatC n=1 Tax=Gracilaria ferox TaxID=1184158 RepID=A0A345UB53_9FLOR|nr:Sec-independent protein translocase component TatC [Gracilaria ferox]AXI97689.1 Sec-independent protein translocase component TatC [Gracilaria ferox]UAD89640.1 Sec-independent protein translocase component TatC [Gracilaria ferox]
MYSKLIYFYSLELFFRLIYVFISFLLCVFIASMNIYYLVFFEVYPFIVYELKKFIVTNVMDLFDVLWLLVISKSFFFVFPYWIFQLFKFNSPSWYLYQIRFFYKSFYFSFWMVLIYLFFVHFSLLPFILSMLTKWEIDNTNLFDIFVEFRIISYIRWVLAFRYFIGTFSFFILLLILHLWFLIKTKRIYFLIKYYRKLFIFGILCMLFLLIPPDNFLQIFCIGSIFLTFELVFLFICYKLCNIKVLKICLHLISY